MSFKIYVDVLFIINLISDYILLSVTAFLLKKHPRPWRKGIAAAVGAFFAAVLFFLPIGIGFLIPSVVAVSCIMVALTFGTRKIAPLLRAVFSFYLVSFAGAGAMFGVFYLQNTSFALRGGILYADINAYMLLVAFLLAIAVIHFACSFIKKATIKSKYLYDVTLRKDGKSVTERALYDTGNFLTDPLSQRSVLLAEWSTVSTLFGTDTLAEAISASPGEFLYIPCRGIGGNTGIFAFCPDEIVSGELSFHNSAYVGISETPLDGDGSFKMILPNTVSITERM